MERLSGHEEYEELSNEPAFSKMVKEWKAYRSTGLSPADIPALTARAEAAEAERDAAVEDLKQHILWNGTACTYCRYCEEAESALSPCDTCEDIPDTKMPTNWEWRGQQETGKGEAE